METPNPIAVLEQRIVFLTSIVEVAHLCNWTDNDIQKLKERINEQLISIDNARYDLIDTGEEAEDDYSEERANFMWHALMEQLRKDLSLILGVKIKYV